MECMFCIICNLNKSFSFLQPLPFSRPRVCRWKAFSPSSATSDALYLMKDMGSEMSRTSKFSLPCLSCGLSTQSPSQHKSVSPQEYYNATLYYVSCCHYHTKKMLASILTNWSLQLLLFICYLTKYLHFAFVVNIFL